MKLISCFFLLAASLFGQNTPTKTTFLYQTIWYGADGKPLVDASLIGSPGTYAVRVGAAVIVICQACSTDGTAGYRVTVTYTQDDGSTATMQKLISIGTVPRDTAGDFFLFGKGDIKRIVTEILRALPGEDQSF